MVARHLALWLSLDSFDGCDGLIQVLFAALEKQGYHSYDHRNASRGGDAEHRSYHPPTFVTEEHAGIALRTHGVGALDDHVALLEGPKEVRACEI